MNETSEYSSRQGQDILSRKKTKVLEAVVCSVVFFFKPISRLFLLMLIDIYSSDMYGREEMVRYFNGL